eukprot:2183165-Prymnesium_polylepis.1
MLSESRVCEVQVEIEVVATSALHDFVPAPPRAKPQTTSGPAPAARRRGARCKAVKPVKP